MKKYPFLFAFIFFTVANVLASDTVIVYKDPRLDVFSSKQAAVNKLTSKMTSTGQYRGYRIQVLNTRNREAAFKAKSDLMQLFPGQKAYVLFQSPYFKVRFGNYPEKADALAYKNRLAKVYPQTCYIVEDIIEYKPKELDEDFPQ